MLSNLVFRQVSAAIAAGVVLLSAASAAQANSPCRADTGLLEFLSRSLASSRPQCGVYQGDYMVDQGPNFSGPAVIAPQHTYAPTSLASAYPYVAEYVAPPPRKRLYRHAVTHRLVSRHAARHKVVSVRDDVPPAKGAPKIIHARAEVRIYGPQRMDIRLYRN